MSRRRYESGKEEVWSSDGRVNAFSFNGKQVKFFSSNSAFGEIKGPGPDMETRVKVLAPQFYEFFRSTYNGIELYEILEPRLKQSTRAVLDSGVSLSFPALGVGRSQADVSDDYVVEVSKEAGGLPVRIRHGVGLLRHPTVVTEMKIQWSGVTPTKWVPRKLEQWVYAKSKPTGLESPAGGYEMIVRQDMAQVNIDMLGEVFDLPFPAGTTVHDNPKG